MSVEVSTPVYFPVGDDFRNKPLHEAHDIDAIVRRFGELDGFVRFESKLADDVDPADVRELGILDERARKAAEKTLQLAFYFADTPDEDGDAANVCGWFDMKEAHATLHDPDHIAAHRFAIGKKMYKYILVSIYHRTQGTHGKTGYEVVRQLTLEDIEAHMLPQAA